MINKKGFVMTETLVVTVFLVTIFTFIYVSIVPLIGKYEDMVYRDSDIDVVYKLYHIRKMVSKDANKVTITSSSFKQLTCNDFANTTYCNKLMQYLGLSNYNLVYTTSIEDNLSSFSTVSSDMYKYISKYQNIEDSVLVLLDNSNHTIAYLIYHG